MQRTPSNQEHDTSDPAGLLPLLSGEGDQRLLHEWIETHDRYTLVDPDQPVEAAAFDCCILDGAALRKHGETLRERKQVAEPILLPCLLLLPEADLSVLDDNDEIADGVVFDAVDEVVSMPIKKAELEWRTDALLRLRSQSVDLDAKRRSLRLFKQATEAAGHAVYITDLNGTIEYVNPAFETLTGYTENEVIGETPEVLDAGEMSEEYFDRLWKTIASGDVWEEDIINRRKTGELYHAHQTIAPVSDTGGDVTNFVAIQSDITPRVEAKQKLQTFNDIVERIDDPIMFQGTDGRFRLVNEAVTDHAEMTRDELIGTTEHAFMDTGAAERIEARKEQVLSEERAVRYTISPQLPGGTDETFSTVRYPHYDDDGTLDGTVAICRTVTELELRDEQLQVIDRVLRHNLRNDMTKIGMFAEKLVESLSGDDGDYARRIQAASHQITQMAEKQREITKFVTDPPRERTFDLVDHVEGVLERQRSRHPDAEIRADLPESCRIRGTSSIQTAVAELVENAVVHSETDAPSVDVHMCPGSEPTVTISDDGPRLPEMERNVLVSGREAEPLYHGSGLGLWLVNLAVTYSGGDVSYTPIGTQSNQITLRFPAVSSDEAQSP